MRACLTLALLAGFSLPFAAVPAKADDYGAGILCPRPEAQISFYTENNQQDASGTLSYQGANGFGLNSTSIRDFASSGAQVVDSLCEAGLPGIRIDAKRDGWLKAGQMWFPPNQEWDYGDWQDFLRKTPVWKSIAPVILYQGTMDVPYKDKPYSEQAMQGEFEIYPIKIVDDYALVVADEVDALGKSCSSAPVAPKGRLGWMRLSGDGGKPLALPTHPKAC